MPRSAVEGQFEIIGRRRASFPVTIPRSGRRSPTCRGSWRPGTCSSTRTPASMTGSGVVGRHGKLDAVLATPLELLGGGRPSPS